MAKEVETNKMKMLQESGHGLTVKCLPGKREGVNSIPSTHPGREKSLVWWRMLATVVLGSQTQADPRAYWAASSADLVSSQPVKDCASENQLGNHLKITQGYPLASAQ